MKYNLFVSNARQFRVDLIDSAASLFFFGITSELAVRSGTRDEDSRLERPTRVLLARYFNAEREARLLALRNNVFRVYTL